MEKSKEAEVVSEPTRKYQRPSERSARIILGIFDWFRDIFTGPVMTIPRGQVVHHQGDYLPAGKEIRFSHILLVEDNPDIARKFIASIKNYYVFGTVKIFVAYTYDGAVTFFFDNEDIKLVIMDADLGDEDGDGAILTQKFLGTRPEIILLANSSNRISNLKLTGFGARETLGKKTDKLQSWLAANDPAGAGG